MRRVLLALLFIFLLTGCSYWGGGGNQYYNPEHARYFQGREGVLMRFDQLPTKLYYYGAEGGNANEFPFAVEVHNVGASYTRGAVFVSGYDPNLIKIQEVPIQGNLAGSCGLRIGDFSYNNFGMTVQCGDSFLWHGDTSDWLRRISVRGKTWWPDGFLDSITYTSTPGGDSFQVGFNDAILGWDQRRRGLELIAILGGLDFFSYYGQEYLLAGDMYDYPGGEIDYLPFHARLDQWPVGADEIPQRFLLTSCYMYTTFAAPMVCIDPNPYVEQRKVCHPAMVSWSSGNGAPVAITRVVQESTPRQAVFHIDVENVGRGTVYDPGSLEKCSPYYPGGAKTYDLDVVWIGAARIGIEDLACTPTSRIVRLRDGRGSFTCTYPMSFAELNSAYLTPLVIELWYGYSEVVERLIPIKRVN